MDELWGVPAHPLFVHLPVVALPALAAGACAMAARPRWRRHYHPHLVVATLVTLMVTLLAVQSGEPLKEALQPGLGTRIDRHADLGDQTALFATLFFVGAAMASGADWWVGRRATATAVQVHALRVVSTITAISGVLAAIWVIRAGHEGARVTWSGVEVGG